jgi:hypothetical protein
MHSSQEFGGGTTINGKNVVLSVVSGASH